MLFQLWLFLRGYVRVSVTGFSIERFLNMATYRGIFLWDILRTDTGVEMNVSIKGFKLLKNHGRKTKCRTRIIKKHGLPFILHRYRKRKLLLGGVLFFILSLYALSTFVWRVDIVGTNTIDHEKIRTYLAEQGLSVGSFKYFIDSRTLSRELIANFDEIGFADIYTKGTRTTVLLAEAIPQQLRVDRTSPSHVVADRDGLITHITAGAGAPLARAGDIVQSGEMLVSGMLQIQSETEGPAIIYVHAYAEVWARRYYPIELMIPLQYTERVYTGRITNRYAVQFLFWKNQTFHLPGSGVSFVNYDKITTQHQPGAGGDYPLPFVWLNTHYAEFTLQNHTRTMAQAYELADRQLNERIMREFDFGIDIIDKRLIFEETPDALLIHALVITNERIDRIVPIEGSEAWNPPTPPDGT
jgi:similar to stage IV sporulation protein